MLFIRNWRNTNKEINVVFFPYLSYENSIYRTFFFPFNIGAGTKGLYILAKCHNTQQEKAFFKTH